MAAPALLAVALLVAQSATAQSPLVSTVLERRVKAALLAQFAELVAWPDTVVEPGKALVIAVAGNDQLAAELRQLVAARSAPVRPIRVRTVDDRDSLDGVQIVFVAAGAWRAGAEWSREAVGKPLLVVTESAGALEEGSVINFNTVDGKVRFELSSTGAEQRGLKLSPRLVAVALKRS